MSSFLLLVFSILIMGMTSQNSFATDNDNGISKLENKTVHAKILASEEEDEDEDDEEEEERM